MIADGNLSTSSLRDLFKRSASVGVDVFFEPTSVQKAVRVIDADAVAYMKYVSPNGDELAAMSEAIHRAHGEPLHSHERFKLSEESKILPKERMTQLKNDLITGSACGTLMCISMI